MPFTSITPEALAAQETYFARAFAEKRREIARPLYATDVAYRSPAVRLYGWPQKIDGIEKTLEFISLTIQRSENIVYEAVAS